MPEQETSAGGDAVDRPFAAGCELHDEKLLASDLGKDLGDLFEPHGQTARALVQKLVEAVGGHVENAEPARARADDRLETDRLLRVAELGRGTSQLAASADASPGRRSHAGCVESAKHSALSVASRIVSGDDTSTVVPAAANSVRATASAVSSCEDWAVPRRRALPAELQERFGEDRARSWRHTPEGVAQVATDRPLARIASENDDLASHLLAQRPYERRRARRPGGGHEHAQRTHGAEVTSGFVCAARAFQRAVRARPHQWARAS